MTESVQRILKQRGRAGQHPMTVGEIIAVLEAAAQGWNAAPTPFVWGGRRAPAANAVANDAMPWAVPAPIRASRFGDRIRLSFNNGDQHVK